MHILAIETSCDETAVAVVKVDFDSTATGDTPHFSELSAVINSQIDIHKDYGGVYPALAQREHSRNILPVLSLALREADRLADTPTPLTPKQSDDIRQTLEREPELATALLDFFSRHSLTQIDRLAVTAGPGLEPALWIGIQFAKAVAIGTGLPLQAVNHMHGHIWSGLIDSAHTLTFQALALLLSGGHTEFIHLDSWQQMKKVGQTLDDAIGEAFDKTARMLGESYPGGPIVSRLAERARADKLPLWDKPLPRPMLGTDNADFSFSGLKTAVLYQVQKLPQPLSDDDKARLAREFEDAVTDIIIKKTTRLLTETSYRTLLIGGGVIANTHLRQALQTLADKHGVELIIPPLSLTGDNATMIAMAAAIEYHYGLVGASNPETDFSAQGNLSV